MLHADNLEQKTTMKQVTIKGELIAQTDIGRVRVTNEDQAVALKSAMGYTLLCVCDGMGGHRKGDYASKLAIDIITEEFQQVGTFLTTFAARHWLIRTIKKINTTIYNEGQSSPIYKDMGTTIIMATHDRDIVNRMKKRVVSIKNGVLVGDYEKGGYKVDETA